MLALLQKGFPFTRDTAHFGYTSAMHSSTQTSLWAATAISMLFVLTACGPAGQSSSTGSPAPSQNSTATARAAAARETPVAPEVNPPGDIPDSQAYVEFVSPAGYSLQAPEGWARSVHGANVTFRDKFDGLSVDVTAKAQTLASIKGAAPAGSGFTTTTATLPAGRAIEIRYASNSEADPVTGKKIRLANEAVIFMHGARYATLRVWAPLGADNVDQWNFIERHFRFR
jgi:hypothetical protein